MKCIQGFGTSFVYLNKEEPRVFCRAVCLSVHTFDYKAIHNPFVLSFDNKPKIYIKLDNIFSYYANDEFTKTYTKKIYTQKDGFRKLLLTKGRHYGNAGNYFLSFLFRPWREMRNQTAFLLRKFFFITRLRTPDVWDSVWYKH